jgi:sugar O-acyltransferase (sialic acid O-acetyltransferase NeuD family)
VKRIIFGAGGTGRTIAAVMRHCCTGSDLAFLDDAMAGQVVNGVPVLGAVADCGRYEEAEFIIGFGTSYRRQRQALWERLMREERTLFNAVFPGSYVDSTATVGFGNLIAANCAVLPNARIGNDCMLCVSVTVDHDSQVGDHCYLSPGVNLAGGVILEPSVFVGTNATILPTIRVGLGSVVGAGAVVTKTVPPGQTVVGVPARPILRSGV